MNSWIHCNNCYISYDRDHQFYMLNCSHILCQGCLKSQVIDRNKECKWCKRPVQIRKISKELDPKLLAHFDSEQHKRIGLIGQSLKIAHLQYRHYTNPTVIKKVIQKTRDLKALDMKVINKSNSMKITMKNLRNKPAMRYDFGKTPSMPSTISPQSFGTGSSGSFGAGSIGGGGYFAQNPINIRKENLLMMPSASSGNSERSAFLPITNARQQGWANQQYVPMKKHPQITRLSKLSAEAAKRYQ